MNKQKVIERIKALQSKTTENGCTEGEALSAMEAAKRLMDKYSISSGDITTGGEEFVESYAPRKRTDSYDIRDKILWNVGRYTDTKPFLAGNVTPCFFGLESDVEFATWLTHMLNDLCQREATAQFGYAGKAANSRKAKRYGSFDEFDLFGGSNSEFLRASFVQGFIDRVNKRLETLIKERDQLRTSDGRSLVISKKSMLENALAKAGYKFRKRKGSSRKTADPRAYGMGDEAGQRAHLGTGVSAGATQKMLA
jgi:hypothetical protein